MKNMPKYSVIVPAYKEEAILKDALLGLSVELKKDESRYLQTEVLVVVADSEDNTAYIAKQCSTLFASYQVLEPGKKVGKGRDVRAGMIAANGEYRLFTDADMATPPKYVYRAFDILEAGNDLVIGIRPLSKIHNSFKRRIRSIVSNLLIRLLAVPGINDTQCGFKGFTKQATISLFEPLETLKWGFDIEILARARAQGLKIATINISDWFDPKIETQGLVGESDWRANLNTLKELMHVFKKRVSKSYKK